MIDITFLKALRDKLKGGNIRSIHLNALPGRYASRLDVTDLNFIEANMARHFMDVLLSKPSFEFKISFDGIDLTTLPSDQQKRLGVLSKRLNSLFIENEDNFKEHGIKTFGFGYPILIKPSKQDPTKIIKAPLFIWQLDITKSFNKVNTWSIIRNKVRSDGGRLIEEMIHSVHLNEVLISYLKGDEGIIIPPINDEFLQDEILNQNEIAQESKAILEKLNTVANLEEMLTRITEGNQKIPEVKELEAAASNKPWIYFGGVFGLYRTQKESIITDLDKLIDNYEKFEFDKLKIEHFTGTVMSAVGTDPSQQSILSSLHEEPRKIIQGPPGTGKSQSLTALITNVLANKMKCLVVCEKKTALDVIKSNLHKENPQLGRLVAVIEDVNKDRDGIVSSIRDRLTQGFPSFGSARTEYDSSRVKLEQYSKIINDYHTELSKNIYSGKAWTRLVGEYIRISKNADSNDLMQYLQPSDFEFSKNDKELETLITVTKQAEKIFIKERAGANPLDDLSNDIFLGQAPRPIQHLLYSETEKFQDAFLESAAKLQEQVKNYKNWLEKHYTDLFNGLNSRATDYLSFFKNALQEHGP